MDLPQEQDENICVNVGFSFGQNLHSSFHRLGLLCVIRNTNSFREPFRLFVFIQNQSDVFDKFGGLRFNGICANKL